MFTRDGEPLGCIETAGREAFKVGTQAEAFWLRYQAVAGVAPGGFAILYGARDELEEWRWVPPAVHLSPDFGD